MRSFSAKRPRSNRSLDERLVFWDEQPARSHLAGKSIFHSNHDDGGCCCRHLLANEGLVQIRRFRSASSRARLRVPSVSAILRLAASSVLIISRADIILHDLATATIMMGGASGVFMVLMGIVLSVK